MQSKQPEIYDNMITPRNVRDITANIDVDRWREWTRQMRTSCLGPMMHIGKRNPRRRSDRLIRIMSVFSTYISMIYITNHYSW